MGFQLKQLWTAPEINPYNKKAKSIPIFNPFDKYGRVFFFSYLGFFIAFWSWYAFPPLMVSIRKDLHLSQNEVANSNIISLTATLVMRAIAGPLCDRFGPRLTFVGCLLAGAIPSALAGTAHNAGSLYAIRFFVGILGGTFVPCQVWTTGFFDRNVIGTANALVGGWGNSGGGITYFVMPAIYDSLMKRQGLTSHVAWRVSFIVPFILITAVAVSMLLVCEDTPTGKWSDRGKVVAPAAPTNNTIVAAPGTLTDNKPSTANSISSHDEKKTAPIPQQQPDVETGAGTVNILDEVQHEIVVKPSAKEIFHVACSLQALTLMSSYICSFGGELAINSILGSYYLKNFPPLGQTTSGRWAAMFGLLNIVTRPMGGFFADLIFRWTKQNLWAKKLWIHFVGVMSGIFLIVIGQLDPKDLSTMVGLIALMAIFLEAGNGANFALVPHVHPHANGVLSGLVGAAGNLGGVIFAIIFRYNGTHYARVFWIIGVIVIGLNLVFIWVRPIPKGQIGGR